MKCNSNFCPFFLGNSQHPWLLGSCRDEIILHDMGWTNQQKPGKPHQPSDSPSYCWKQPSYTWKLIWNPKNWCLEDDVPFQSGTYFRFHVYFWGEYCKPVEIYTICTYIYVYMNSPFTKENAWGDPPFGFFAPEISGCVENHPRRRFRACGGSGCWSLVAWEFLLRSRLGGDFGAKKTKKKPSTYISGSNFEWIWGV